MARIITGTIPAKEGARWRTHQVITCTDCGFQTYMRRSKRVQKVIETPCKRCSGIRTSIKKERDTFLREQDMALLQALKTVSHLAYKLHKPDTRVVHDCCWHRKTYDAWKNMISRCYDPNNCSYNEYGARGITVVDHWLESPEWFFIEMGLAPDGLSLDRIDNMKGYSPENCRWATDYVQSNNRREYKQHEVRSSSWWRAFNLITNPYIYGPMPWKRGSLKYRKEEAVSMGWYKSPRIRIKK